MGKQTYSTSYQELSRLIIEAIEDEQFFNKELLIPRVKAIMKGFSLNLNVEDYSKERKPSEVGKILFSNKKLKVEQQFWHNIVRELHPEKIQDYYKEFDEIRRKMNSEQNAQASVATDDDSSTNADKQIK